MTIATGNAYTFTIFNQEIKTGTCKEVCAYLANITSTDLPALLVAQARTYTSISVLRELITIHAAQQGYEDNETGFTFK